jgi:hypothetical protein
MGSREIRWRKIELEDKGFPNRQANPIDVPKHTMGMTIPRDWGFFEI